MENEGNRCGNAKYRTDAPPEKRVRANGCGVPLRQQLAFDSVAALIPKLAPDGRASRSLRWQKASHHGFSLLVPRLSKKRSFPFRHIVLEVRSRKEEQFEQFSSIDPAKHKNPRIELLISWRQVPL